MDFSHIHIPWAFICGILGNIISFMVYLAPLGKSTEGFQSIPYLVALFSAMLWIYYALVKTDAMLLITINAVGCVIETIYIALYVFYAPKNAMIFTAKLILLINVGLFSLIVLLTQLLARSSNRVKVLGSICVAFSVSVFIAPLSIMRRVMRTKSVEFMPFFLSFFLTLSAVTWFLYGLSLRDYYIALPNVLGFTFGVIQMILYAIYRTKNEAHDQQRHDHDVENNVAGLSTAGISEVHPIEAQETSYVDLNVVTDQNSHEHIIIRGEKRSMGSQNGVQLSERGV